MDKSKEDFLASAARVLVEVCHKAELTQAQVAERMGTKQSAIARMENDKRGAISMRRFVAYALACGYVPFNLVYAQNDPVFRAWYPVFREANPGVPFTLKNVADWERPRRALRDEHALEARSTRAKSPSRYLSWERKGGSSAV